MLTIGDWIDQGDGGERAPVQGFGVTTSRGVLPTSQRQARAAGPLGWVQVWTDRGLVWWPLAQARKVPPREMRRATG